MWNKWQHTRILFRFIKTYSWPSQANSMKCFAKMVSGETQLTIFAKRFILGVSLGSEYVSDYHLWIRLSFVYYYFFHFESIKFRRICSQMSFKLDVFKNFAILTGKNLCWNLFLIKLLACKPANLLKRNSNTSVFLLILLYF